MPRPETEPATAGARRKAPWPDYAGNDIHELDRIQHPTDDSVALVFYDESREGVARWRAVYLNGESLWLGNQIGDKGRAVVVDQVQRLADATGSTREAVERWLKENMR
jgi:hypothetical protein